MNGALLGMNHKEVEAIYDEIVSFAELEKFMDQKLKNYSSGMQVRLAFSIAIQSKSEILLFDEVLAVGDASFQQKCYETFSNMKDSGRTIVLVTHDMSAVQRFCEKAILIDNGKIILQGKPSEIADKYLEQNFEKKSDDENLDDIHSVKMSNISLTSEDRPVKALDINQPIDLSFSLEKNATGTPVHIGFQIFNSAGAYCFGTNTLVSSKPAIFQQKAKVKFSLKQSLVPGTYYITLAVMDQKANKVIKYLPKVTSFNVKQQSEVQGVAFMNYEWKIENV